MEVKIICPMCKRETDIQGDHANVSIEIGNVMHVGAFHIDCMFSIMSNSLVRPHSLNNAWIVFEFAPVTEPNPTVN